MKSKNFFSVLNNDNRYIVKNLLYIQLIQGLYAILIGAIFPMMQKEYAISYNIGGLMLSGHSLGQITGSLIAGVFPSYIGLKKSMIFLNSIAYMGFATMLFTDNPIILIIAFILSGIGRGSKTNYNTGIVNDITDGSGPALNLVHASFATGAFIAPILVLAYTKNNSTGWKYAILTVIVLGVISLFSSTKMKLKTPPKKTYKKDDNAFGFFKDKLFIIALSIVFLYLCMEAAVIGWIPTYFVDRNTFNPEYAQVLTSMFWMALLIGRIICVSISNKVKAEKLVLFLSCGSMIFLVILLLSRSLLFMSIGTFGLGLSFSGIYATAIAGVSAVIKKYSHAMGFFVAIAGIGAIMTPSIVGMVSEKTSIHTGMSVLIIFAVLQLGFAAYNVIFRKKLASEE